MANFPIPKLRSNWAAALMIAVILFLIYYLFVFDSLLRLYTDQFDRVDFVRSQNQLKIWAFVPRYYNSSELAWVYIHVENESDNPIYDISIHLILNSSSDKSILLLPNLYNEEVYATEAKFDIIAPHSVAIARISFVAQAEPRVSKVLLVRVNDGMREELERLNPEAFVRVNRSSWRALQHSFLETVLLPPWSNGFILGLVLFATYLSRSPSRQMEEDEPEAFVRHGFGLNPAWWMLVKQNMWDAGKILLIMILLIALLLLVDESTFPPLAGIAALVWLVNLGNPERLRRHLTVGTLLLVSLGFLWLLFDTLNTIWIISVTAFVLVWLLTKRDLSHLKRLEFWGFLLAVLGSTWLWFSLDQVESTLVRILWALMTLTGLGVFFWQMALIYSQGIARRSGVDAPVNKSDSHKQNE